MRRVRIAAAVTFGGLAMIVAIKLALPATATVQRSQAAAPAAAIELHGMLYDFRRRHPDFDLRPSVGFGHYAANVQPVLDASRRPVLAAGGYRVVEQWEDRAGRRIAPHVAGLRGGVTNGGVTGEVLGFRVDGAIELHRDAVVDAFDSNEGAYGAPGNVGRHGIISTNATDPGAVRIHDNALVRGDVLVGPRATPMEVIESRGYVTGRRAALGAAVAMPAPALPEHLEPYRARIAIDTSTTLTGDLMPDDGRNEPALHCGEFRLSNDAVLTIAGDLVIRCDQRLDLRRGRIDLRPGASLTVFVSGFGGGSGDVRIDDRALVNADGADPTRVRIFALGPGRLEIGRSHVYATIVAPERRLDVRDAGHLYGAFIGASLRVGRLCGLHADLGIAAPGRSNHGLSVRESIVVREGSTIDSFDSGDGPYDPDHPRAGAWVSTNGSGVGSRVELSGDSTIRGVVSIGPAGALDDIVTTDAGSYVSGPVGRLATGHPVPFVAAPDLGPSVGDRHYAGGVHVIHGDLRCRNLTIADGAIVNVLGSVSIRVDETLTMTGRAEMRVDPGATLTIHVGRDVRIDRRSMLNDNTSDPRLVSIRMTGTGRITVNDHSRVCAWMQGSGAHLAVTDHSDFAGSFVGRSVEVGGNAWVHVDTADLTRCVEVFDAPGTPGPAGRGGVTSAESFGEWFRPVSGTNEAAGHVITLHRDTDGVYSFVDDTFYPLDGRGLGNERDVHNHHFTSAVWARFRYESCAGQFVSFEGGDGAWLFIDGRLALDLGGVRTRTVQHIDLDRLGLESGRTYSFRLFTAQRHRGESVFRLRTNIELESDHTAPDLAARFE